MSSLQLKDCPLQDSFCNLHNANHLVMIKEDLALGQNWHPSAFISNYMSVPQLEAHTPFCIPISPHSEDTGSSWTQNKASLHLCGFSYPLSLGRALGWCGLACVNRDHAKRKYVCSE